MFCSNPRGEQAAKVLLPQPSRGVNKRFDVLAAELIPSRPYIWSGNREHAGFIKFNSPSNCGAPRGRKKICEIERSVNDMNVAMVHTAAGLPAAAPMLEEGQAS